MILQIKKNPFFKDLVVFKNSAIRKLLDLQYRSLCAAEKKLFVDLDLSQMKILDFGAGDQDFKRRHRGKEYFSVDLFGPADWKTLAEIPAAMDFDLIVCTEVLEHLATPLETLKALASLQRPGQKIYITTPFMAREHGAPDDFQRWTTAGLAALLDQAGYRIGKSTTRGNLLSVISAFLNYRLFYALRSRYFPIALLAAPFIFLALAFAHITLKWAGQDIYLGLSVVASKRL